MAGDAVAGVDPAESVAGAGTHYAGRIGAAGVVLRASFEFDRAWEGDLPGEETKV